MTVLLGVITCQAGQSKPTNSSSAWVGGCGEALLPRKTKTNNDGSPAAMGPRHGHGGDGDRSNK